MDNIMYGKPDATVAEVRPLPALADPEAIQVRHFLSLNCMRL
jgi:hypothetical protein